MSVVHFGPYKLARLIGKGGMAEVYLAQTGGTGGFSKYLAIKRLLGSYNADKQLVSMLADEARLSVGLHHPNIVQVFDFGCVDGVYYIAMEFVDGCDLSAIIRARNDSRAGLSGLPLATAVYVVLQVMDALDYAHRRRGDDGKPIGIIHRDVSPHNILISREGQVKLADFGLARASISAHHSQAGIIRGKFAYMPKEQAHGRTIDHRIDIFAAGVTLYEALTGIKPYSSKTLAQQLYQLEKEIEPPSRHNPDIPPEIDDLTLQALCPDPNDRYQSAAEMADDLRHALWELSTPNQEAHHLAEYVREESPSRPELADADLRASLLDMEAPQTSLIRDEIDEVRRTIQSSSYGRTPAAEPSQDPEDAQTREIKRDDEENFEAPTYQINRRDTDPDGAPREFARSRRDTIPDPDEADEFDQLAAVESATSAIRARHRRASSTSKAHRKTNIEKPRPSAKKRRSSKKRRDVTRRDRTRSVRRTRYTYLFALSLTALSLLGIGIALGWLLRQKVYVDNLRGRAKPSQDDVDNAKETPKPKPHVMSSPLGPSAQPLPPSEAKVSDASVARPKKSMHTDHGVASMASQGLRR